MLLHRFSQKEIIFSLLILNRGTTILISMNIAGRFERFNGVRIPTSNSILLKCYHSA